MIGTGLDHVNCSFIHGSTYKDNLIIFRIAVFHQCIDGLELNFCINSKNNLKWMFYYTTMCKNNYSCVLSVF